jgi:hypothetical protein
MTCPGVSRSPLLRGRCGTPAVRVVAIGRNGVPSI